MQNRAHLEADIAQVRRAFGSVTVLQGDRYVPVLGLVVPSFTLPPSIIESCVTLTIPMPRCAGFFQDAAISGVHINCELHTLYKGEITRVPFCHPIGQLSELTEVARYYPIYESSNAKELLETFFVCLFMETGPPLSAFSVIQILYSYLEHCIDNVLLKARTNCLTGNEATDRQRIYWLRHMLKGVSGSLKEHIEHIAGVKEEQTHVPYDSSGLKLRDY